MESMRILVTLDEAYLPPLQVLLTSLHVNHPGETMEICLLHAGIPAGQLLPVKRQCERFCFVLREVEVDGAVFAGAPVTRRSKLYLRAAATRPSRSFSPFSRRSSGRLSRRIFSTQAIPAAKGTALSQ